MRSREDKLKAYSSGAKRGAAARKRMLKMKEPGLGESQARYLGMFDRALAGAGSENARTDQSQCTANLNETAPAVNRVFHLLS
jgi:hypothetical protein